MNRGRAWRSIAVVTALVAALLSVGMPSASAHVHPTPKDLVGPGVVYIESGFHVEIALIEHSLTQSHILVVQRSYDVVLTKGSGFAVDPSAVIVTAGVVVSPDPQAATNFAVNSIFHERYPTLALPTDPLTQEQLGQVPDDYSPENRLRACYLDMTNASAGGCVIKLTRVVKAYPYVTDQGKYGNLLATVLTPAEGTSADIAVLRVPAGSMPTVNLVDPNATTYHLGVLGFDGIPGKSHLLVDFKAHLDKPGGTKFKAAVGDNAPFKDVTPKVLSAGLQGGPVAAELGQVIGLIAPPAQVNGQAAGPPVLVPTKAIDAVLAKLPVTPQRGPADGNYESAMHKFQNNGFAASIPGFQNALSVYPGDFLAAQNLAIAVAKVKAGQAGPSDVATQVSSLTAPSSTGIRWWVWVIIGVAVLLAAAAAAYLFAGRRKRPPGKPATPPIRPGAPVAPPPPAARRSSGPIPAETGAKGGSRPIGAGSSALAAPPASGPPPRPASSAAASRPGSAAGAVRAASQRLGPTPPPPSNAGGRQTPRSHAEQPSRNSEARGQRVVADAGPSNARGPAFCTSCGGRLAPHHQFCGWCGDPVG